MLTKFCSLKRVLKEPRSCIPKFRNTVVGSNWEIICPLLSTDHCTCRWTHRKPRTNSNQVSLWVLSLSIWAQSNMVHLCYRPHVHTTSKRFTQCELNTLAALCQLIFKYSGLFLLSFSTCGTLNCACKQTVDRHANRWCSVTQLQKEIRPDKTHPAKHVQTQTHAHPGNLVRSDLAKKKQKQKNTWTFG